MRELAQYAKELFGIHINASQLEAFEIYERELLDWNTRMNLTAIQDPEMIRTKHFLDSLSCLSVMRETRLARVVDIGTGAGFPGLPLKILQPSMQLTLVESVGKKVNFCRHIVEVLDLKDVETIQARAEELGQSPNHRERYDWAIARAVANLPILAEYLLPLVKVGGRMLAMKGDSGPAEAHTAEHAIHILGGHLHKLVPVTLPGVVEERYLIIVDKIATTPRAYPRRVGVPAKKPL